jgi:anti-sigma regulatory factor (Ser/Thr protein kinase)
MLRREWHVQGGALAPRAARAAVRGLAADVDPDVLGDLELLVSELATNSVRHARAGEDVELLLRVEVADARVRVRWCDGGPGFANPPLRPHADGIGGYGLVLVDRLAARWGIERGERFCVWFELELAARSAA